MAATETIGIRVEAEIQDLIAEFSKIPGVTDKQAREALKKLDVNLTKMRRAAEKQARAQAKAYDKAFDDMGRAAERSASLMGGVFGDISDSILDLGGQIKDIAGGIGGLGGVAFGVVGGIGALTAAIGFAGHAMIEWLDTADDLRESLEGVAGVPPLADSTVAALDSYGHAAAAADAYSARLSLTLMGQLAPAMQGVQESSIGLASSLTHLMTGMDAFRNQGGIVSDALDTLDKGMRRLTYVTTLGLAYGLDSAREAGAELAAQMEEVAEAIDFGPDFGPSLDLMEKGTRKVTAAKQEQIKAWDEGLDVQAMEAEMRAGWAADDAARLEAQTAADADASAARLAQIEAEQAAQAQAIADADAMRQASHDLEMGLVAMKRDGYMEMYQSVGAASVTLAEGVIATMERQNDLLDEEFAKGKRKREQERAELDRKLEAGQIDELQYKQSIARIAAEGHAARKEHAATQAAQQKAAVTAFRVQQGAAITDAIMQAAVNAVKLTASFWYLGPGAPAAAIGVAGAQLAGQLAVIRSQKPPEFPTGGMVTGGMSPDHVSIGAQVGEAVLTRQGVQDIGGPDAVDAINAGRGGAGGAIYVVLDGEVLGRAVEAAAERGYLGRDTSRRGPARGRRSRS